jgi:hypothetical protein
VIEWSEGVKEERKKERRGEADEILDNGSSIDLTTMRKCIK